MDLYKDTAFIYDYDNRSIAKDDIPFYKKIIPPGSSVLELAAGTGRVAIELAEHGCLMTCLDLSDEMLAVFIEKIRGLPKKLFGRIEIVKGDMRVFDLGRTFNWIIIPFRSFQWLITESDRITCLESIKQHMDSTSTTVITLFNPLTDFIEHWGIYKDIEGLNIDLPDGKSLRRFESQGRHDKVNQVIECNNIYRIYKNNELISEHKHNFDLFYMYPDQVRGLLQSNGLMIESVYGYYDFQPIKDDIKLEQIYILKKAE
jgi:SAM-dependent methyltransferase